jgi:hypothetical protein
MCFPDGDAATLNPAAVLRADDQMLDDRGKRGQS